MNAKYLAPIWAVGTVIGFLGSASEDILLLIGSVLLLSAVAGISINAIGSGGK